MELKNYISKAEIFQWKSQKVCVSVSAWIVEVYCFYDGIVHCLMYHGSNT